VISPLPEGWSLCVSCEMLIARANLDKPPYDRGLDEYPPEWQEDFRRLSALIFDLAARYGDSISIQLFDPRSVKGLIKSIQYWVHHYPSIIVAGSEKVVGWDIAHLKEALQAAGAIEQMPRQD